MYLHPPVGYVGGTATFATLKGRSALASDCRPTAMPGIGSWTRYQLGAAV
ncbi:MAG: hypothetical protein ACRD2W_16430 [Acidimicrobiales bacterium]